MFLTNAPQVTASSFCERQTRSKPFRSVWGTTRQVKANKHNFLSTSSALFPPAPGMHTSNTDRFHLQDCCGSREVGMGPGENATRISSWDSASFFFFLLVRHLSGGYKPLTHFQSSKKIDFASFCQFIHCVYRGMGSWSSPLHHFAGILTVCLCL